MKLRNNSSRSGQALIEAIFTLLISIGLALFMIEYALIGISKRIVQWGCFRAARTLLPYGEETPVLTQQAENEARTVLRLIPFKRGEPVIRSHSSSMGAEVSIEITQTITLIGKGYAVDQLLKSYPELSRAAIEESIHLATEALQIRYRTPLEVAA
ncbi:MAG: hypothetical protein AAB309_05410 [Deltaproteobacteria bacterium]